MTLVDPMSDVLLEIVPVGIVVAMIGPNSMGPDEPLVAVVVVNPRTFRSSSTLYSTTKSIFANLLIR